MQMKLSEAVLLGSTIVKPRRGQEWARNGSGCARGMALEAVGLRRKKADQRTRFEEQWPWTKIKLNVHRDGFFACGCSADYDPESSEEDRIMTFSDLIAHMFDAHVMLVPSDGLVVIACSTKMTLDDLVAYIRTVEPKQRKADTKEDIAIEDAVKV